jgi:hypothetical protein
VSIGASSGREQLLAHAHQRHGAGRGEIEPAKQLLSPRLARFMNAVGRGVGGRAFPCLNRRRDLVAIRSEARQQHLEKRDPRAGLQLRIAAEDFARQRDARGLAADRQELLAQTCDALGTHQPGRFAPPIDQCAAAVGDGLQQLAKKRRIHLAGPATCPINVSGNHVAISGKKHKITMASRIVMT